MTSDVVRGSDGLNRCHWSAQTERYARYHDDEWGRPTRDDRWLFEKLCLEGFQSGLSWLTILNKRENFRTAFANFEVERVAAFGPDDVERLVADAGIVRHRGKIVSTLNNARRALELRSEFGSIARFVWQFEPAPHVAPAMSVDGSPALVSQTPESKALSKALKKRGWSFVGPTTMYAFMQASGIVNDHAARCHAREACESARQAFKSA